MVYVNFSSVVLIVFAFFFLYAILHLRRWFYGNFSCSCNEWLRRRNLCGASLLFSSFQSSLKRENAQRTLACGSPERAVEMSVQVIIPQQVFEDGSELLPVIPFQKRGFGKAVGVERSARKIFPGVHAQQIERTFVFFKTPEPLGQFFTTISTSGRKVSTSFPAMSTASP